VATSLPTIVGRLGGLNQLSWVVTAYLLTSTVSVPLYGKFSDIYSRKLVFQVAIVLFVTGSMLCGLSQNMLQLILFRGLQGLGGGGLMAVAQAIVGDVVARVSAANTRAFSVASSPLRASLARCWVALSLTI